MPTNPDIIVLLTQDQHPLLASLHSQALIQSCLDSIHHSPAFINRNLMHMRQNRLANHLDGVVDAEGFGEGFPEENIRISYYNNVSGLGY
jgi:hypothetical protein